MLVGSTAGCVGWSIVHTTVSAPGLAAGVLADLPAEFADEILVLVVWEKFDYVYGEGGERREGFVLAPPRVLERSQLSRLGALTKSLRYSRKSREGTDEGTWERGHRPHGLLMVSAAGSVERFLAKSDPPRDFEVAWREHSSEPLAEEAAMALAEAFSCPSLTQDEGACSFGPLAPLFTPDAVDYYDADEKPVLTLGFDAPPRDVAASFLRELKLSN